VHLGVIGVLLSRISGARRAIRHFLYVWIKWLIELMLINKPVLAHDPLEIASEDETRVTGTDRDYH